MVLFAQDKINFFPNSLNVQPYAANILEPRLGFTFKTDVNALRMDICNSQDIMWYKYDDKTTLSFGADLFTYTLLRKEKDFHFPVDAVDYLFGVNFGYKKELENNCEIGARLRVSHISTHMVDGHLQNYRDNDGKQPLYWIDSIPAKVYSREFIEFIPYYRYQNLRVYAGYTYVFHIDPGYLGKNIYEAGLEYYFENWLHHNASPFIAYDIKLHKVNNYVANNNLIIGLKFGNYQKKGFSIFYNFYNGMNFHGQYFKYRDKYSALGFNIDL